MEELRNSVVSGKFYPQDKGELYSEIGRLIDAANIDDITFRNRKLKALLLPHSGYSLAGDIYAAGFSLLKDIQFDEVFLLSSSHFHKFSNVAFSQYKYWETPLGQVEQSHRIEQIAKSDDTSTNNIFHFDNTVHRGEHSLEVQLPFLQYMTEKSFKIIPTLVGDVSPRLVAAPLAEKIDSEDLLVVSCELSQGYPADYADELDKLTIKAILNRETDQLIEGKLEATSTATLAVLSEVASQKRWTPKLLKYKNSSHVNQDESKVSGYVAVGYFE